MKRTLSGKLHPVCFSPTHYDIDKMTAGSEAEAFNVLSFVPFVGLAEYVNFGDAFDVTVEIDTDLLITGTIAALRSQQQTVRAEAEAKAVDIERQIQTLLAIGMDPQVAPVESDDEVLF